MEATATVRMLGALAQPTRLAIFRLLVRRGPSGMNAGAIAEKLAIVPATLSFHLKELDHAGLVKSRQDGRYVVYAADFRAINRLVTFLTENCCGGNPCTASSSPAEGRVIREEET